MDISNTYALESNKQVKINFNGGSLSSDAGLLLIKEFAAKIGFIRQIAKKFKTSDRSVRIHTDAGNLMQVIYQIIAAYFEDNCADELRNDPVFTSVLGKEALASQPTLSRFFNRMDGFTLDQFDDIDKAMRKLRIGTVRIRLMKIAARVIRSARYVTFKLCSSCPYKEEL